MDQLIQHWINNEATAPWLDHFMAIITNFAAWKPFFAGAFLAGLIFGGFRMRTMLLCLAITVGFTDGILDNSIKHAVGRPRPFQSESNVRVVHLVKTSPQCLAMTQAPKVKYSVAPPEGFIIKGRSFPSSHASNIVAAAMVVFLFYRRWGWLSFFIAAIVIYSRVYTGVHWPSDVAAGAVLGYFSALVIVTLLNKAWQRWGTKIAPLLAAKHPSLV